MRKPRAAVPRGLAQRPGRAGTLAPNVSPSRRCWPPSRLALAARRPPSPLRRSSPGRPPRSPRPPLESPPPKSPAGWATPSVPAAPSSAPPPSTTPTPPATTPPTRSKRLRNSWTPQSVAELGETAFDLGRELPGGPSRGGFDVAPAYGETQVTQILDPRDLPRCIRCAQADPAHATRKRQRRWAGTPRALRKVAATSRVAASAPSG
jgi:hypothetical protein